MSLNGEKSQTCEIQTCKKSDFYTSLTVSHNSKRVCIRLYTRNSDCFFSQLLV